MRSMSHDSLPMNRRLFLWGYRRGFVYGLADILIVPLMFINTLMILYLLILG